MRPPLLLPLMRFCTGLLLAGALAGAPATAALGAGPGLQYEEGVARNPQTRAELYREQHWLRRDGLRPLERLVLYRCPDGAAFARKRIDYRHSDTAPEFVFDDRRSGYREGLRRGATPQLFFRTHADSRERAASIGDLGLVADAGFDEFIRRHWHGLVGGESQSLSFAVPSRLRSLGFSLRRAGQAVVAGEPAWIFQLKLDGWLGLVVPAIDVSYGQASRRLLRFEGLSNLRDDAGDKPLLARIDFAGPVRAVDEAQWRAALAAPLSACRTGR